MLPLLLLHDPKAQLEAPREAMVVSFVDLEFYQQLVYAIIGRFFLTDSLLQHRHNH